MTVKERLLGAIQGNEIDRVPWSPFLAYFWDFQSAEIQQKGQLKYLQDMHADPLLRGFQTLYNKEYKNCNTSTKEDATHRTITYETPVGTLVEEYTYISQSNTWFLTGHPIKEVEDLKILMYMFEHLKITENLQPFADEYHALGDNGLYLPVIGTELKTSFQSLVEHWVGTENLIYMLCDEPDAVESCLAQMREKAMETVEISVKSQAEGFIFWEDSSTTNINPTMFDTYTAPEINDWGNVVHREGKLLVHHACGHIKDLIPRMKNTNIDAIESISPPPTGNIELVEAKTLLGDSKIALIGGVEPTVFLNSNLQELTLYVKTLLGQMKNHAFILANSDSCPPGVSLEKFKLISELVRAN